MAAPGIMHNMNALRDRRAMFESSGKPAGRNAWTGNGRRSTGSACRERRGIAVRVVLVFLVVYARVSRQYRN